MRELIIWICTFAHLQEIYSLFDGASGRMSTKNPEKQHIK